MAANMLHRIFFPLWNQSRSAFSSAKLYIQLNIQQMEWKKEGIGRSPTNKSLIAFSV